MIDWTVPPRTVHLSILPEQLLRGRTSRRDQLQGDIDIRLRLSRHTSGIREANFGDLRLGVWLGDTLRISQMLLANAG